jgi:exopolyphosphatase/guanosine-5'-triphosphate,3'-diphosphate pyrophosphatase
MDTQPAPPLGGPATKRLAAIDIGSNSIRLIVADATADGEYRIVDDHKETTRLAHGLATTGSIATEAMWHSLDALRRMAVIVDGYDADRFTVIATSAVREATNGGDFLRLVKAQLDLDVEVISSEEEGRLSFLSMDRHLHLRDQNVLHVDLGGGSAELVFATQGIIEEIVSLPIGAVRLTEGFLKSDPPTKVEYRAMRKRIKQEFRSAVRVPTFQPHVMTGAGGTFSALANVSLRMRGQGPRPVGGYELTRTEIRHILARLRDLPLAERRSLPGLNPDRADIIIAGVAVIERLMKWLDVNRLVVHDRGVRDGLLLKMLDQAFERKLCEEPVDPLTAVRQFAATCSAEYSHARHIAALAVQIFDQLQEPLRLPPHERLLLEAAAWLHEVGTLINYQKHHQHSYHLILHGSLRGLTTHQRELVANIARYHRKAHPKKKHANFARLSPEGQATVRRMAALLRLADGLDRTHTQRIRALACRVENGVVRVMATADADPVVDLWGATDKGTLFEEVFGKRLEFGWQPTRSADRAGTLAEPRKSAIDEHRLGE